MTKNLFLVTKLRETQCTQLWIRKEQPKERQRLPKSLQLLGKMSTLICSKTTRDCQSHRHKWKCQRTTYCLNLRIMWLFAEFIPLSCTSFCHWEPNIWRANNKILSSSLQFKLFQVKFGTALVGSQEFSSSMGLLSWLRFLEKLRSIRQIRQLF